jgi:hypothetical protein
MSHHLGQIAADPGVRYSFRCLILRLASFEPHDGWHRLFASGI